VQVQNNLLKLQANYSTKSNIQRFYDIPEVAGRLRSHDAGWHSRYI
jgi:hypothetical protein